MDGLIEAQERTVHHDSREIEMACLAVSVSPACAQGLSLFFTDGILPGSFLLAVLENNLIAAVRRADRGNAVLLPLLVNALCDKLSGSAWGSPEKVQKWHSEGGLRGRYRAGNEDQERIQKEWSARQSEGEK